MREGLKAVMQAVKRHEALIEYMVLSGILPEPMRSIGDVTKVIVAKMQMNGANMHYIKHEESFPFNNNTLVVLKAKCPGGEAIIQQSGSHWIAKPLPKRLKAETLKDVFRGCLYLRSMLTQHRFVHVTHDRLFNMVFETKDSVMVKGPIMPQPSQA